MALTDEDKKFLIKIGQVVPVEVKVTKPPKETLQRKGRGISDGHLFIQWSSA
jgi:hypothetical protein